LANAIDLFQPASNLTVDSGAGNFTLTGAITGPGLLTKIGAGSLVLSGDSNYAGGTNHTAGTIVIGSNTALGTGTFTYNGQGTRVVSGIDNLVVANNFVLNDNNTLNNPFDTQAFTTTLTGQISGAGAFAKLGDGTLILTGDNNYAGGTDLLVGRISVGTSTAVGTGNLNLRAGTTLQAFADNLALTNTVTTSVGVEAIDTQAFTFTLGGAISGDGTLTKIGGGRLVLTGANSYTGGTNLTAGSLQINNSSAIGTGTLTTTGGTTLIAGIGAGNAPITLGNAVVLGAGTTNIDLQGTATSFFNDGTVTTNGTTLTLNGVVSGGALNTLDGGGKLVLNGVNTYSGGTTVGQRVAVYVGNGSALGTGAVSFSPESGLLNDSGSAITLGNAISLNNGAVAIGGNSALTLTGVTSGTSQLSKIGPNNLTITAASTRTGSTYIGGGTVTVTNNLSLGTGIIRTDAGSLTPTLAAGVTGLALANNIQVESALAALTVNSGTGIFTLNGVVSGVGGLIKTGTGTLVLNGVNTYANGTELTSGAITATNNASLGLGTLTMSDATTLNAGVTGLTLANNIVTLGAATVNSGASPAALTLAGVVSGAGSLNKVGTGTLNMTGASTFTGGATVTAGTMNVTGSLVSSVNVLTGGTIAGTGTIGSLTVQSGGFVAPGATPGVVGTLNVNGTTNLLAGSTFTANVTVPAADRITSTGALTIAGNINVLPTPAGGFNTFNATYIVASGSSRTGTFATVTGLDQFGIAFAPVMVYDATTAAIRLAPQSLELLGNRFGGLRPNPLEVARAFDRAVAAGYNPQAFFPVYNSGSNLQRTLDQMSGEQRSAERRVLLDSTRVVRETAFDRLNAGLSAVGGQSATTDNGDSQISVWMRGAGSWGQASSDAVGSTFQTEQRGVLTGIDWTRDTFKVGAMFHYLNTEVRLGDLGQSTVESTGGSIYAGYRAADNGLAIGVGGSVAGARANGSRTITLPDFRQSLRANYNGTIYQLFGEVAYDLSSAENSRIEPFARIAYTALKAGAFAETGGVAALTASKQDYDATVANAGVRGTFQASDKISLGGSVAWQGTWGDRSAATLVGIPALGQLSNVQSVAMDKNSVLFQADAAIDVASNVRFSLGYSGLIGKKNEDHGARATLTVGF
uniref:autotransporter domain-containing protein n=1 Tax=Sandarakinorhabdus sp. TaxID=1916663 RepID=UPI00286EA1AE